MKGEFVYSHGYTISQARKIFKFYFGDFLIKAIKNDEKLRFDIYLHSEIENEHGDILNIEDFVDIEYFNQYWNELHDGFNLIILSGKR